jgi:hypothetical protein
MKRIKKDKKGKKQLNPDIEPDVDSRFRLSLLRKSYIVRHYICHF